MNALEQYRNAVKNYAARGVDYLFHNEGEEHALIIFTNIFINAKNTIRIAANKLCNKEVVNKKEYVDSLSAFLNKEDARLFILLTNRPTTEEANVEGCLYKMLYNHPAYKEGRILIKDGNGKSFRDKEKNIVHFCMGDETMYRIENDVVERKAIANFGDSKTTKVLNESFDNAFNSVTTTVNLHDYYGLHES